MTGLRSSVPTTVFEDACIATTQVVGHNKNISVVFRGDQAYTSGTQVVLPSLPPTTRLDIDQQQIGAGYVDHETAHLLYSDNKDWEAALLANPDVLFKSIFNCLEDPRIETKMIAAYPGSRHHLACCSDAVAKEMVDNIATMQQQGQLTLRGIGPYAMSLGGSLRNGAAGDMTTQAWNLVPEEIREWAEDQLDKLANCKNTKQTGELAKEIYDQIKDPNVFTLPQPMAVKVKGQAGGKGKGKGGGKGKAEKGDKGDDGTKQPADGDADDERDDGKGDPAGAGGGGGNERDAAGGGGAGDDDEVEDDNEDEDAEQGAGGDDAEADGDPGDQAGGAGRDAQLPQPAPAGAGQAAVAQAGGGAGGHGNATPLVQPFLPDKDFKKILDVTPDPAAYTIYSREADRVIELRPGVDHHSVHLDMGLEAYNKRVMGGRASVIRRKIERALLSKQLTGWNERQEEGRLDNRRLVNAYAGHRDVYRQRTDAPGFDTAVSLMIDRSGSMGGGSDRLAAEAAINMCLAVEQAGIACEVSGFQDGEERRSLHGKADRIHGVELVVFKPFDIPTARCRIGLGAASRAVNSGTPDGDGTMMAYLRLRKRPEKRKVMITLTDGAPGSTYGTDNPAASRRRHHQYVRDVIAWMQSEGTEVIGLGIQSDAVQRFYDKWVVIQNAEDIVGEPMTQLARILIGGRFEASSNLIKSENRLRA